MIIGIDPGVGSTGIALIDNGRLFKHKTMRGNDALFYIADLHTIYKYDRAVVEKPKQAVFYARHLTKTNSVRSQAGVIKLAQNVGMNIKLTQDLADKLHALGVRVKEVNPRRGSTKWEIGYWTRIFKWESGRTPSEHARDAAVLAFQWETGWDGSTMPYRQCKHAGCIELVRIGGTGYCPKHEADADRNRREAWKRHDQERSSAAERGYGSRWQKAREAYLKNHPLCADCQKRGIVAAATVVDHIVPHRGDMKLFWDRSNWQGLCGACHNRKTARGE